LQTDRGEKSNFFTLEFKDFSTQNFIAPTPGEKKNWAENLWRAWEEVAQKKVFEVDLIELMSRQQVCTNFIFSISLFLFLFLSSFFLSLPLRNIS
jgi:hypothetical protein